MGNDGLRKLISDLRDAGDDGHADQLSRIADDIEGRLLPGYGDPAAALESRGHTAELEDDENTPLYAAGGPRPGQDWTLLPPIPESAVTGYEPESRAVVELRRAVVTNPAEEES